MENQRERLRSFGGQLAYSRQRFVPVSKVSAFGGFQSPLPLRW